MAGLKLVEETMQRRTPHTLNALQHLVMAMADVRKNAGKKSFFGRDKGQEAYAKFLAHLKATVHSMILDGLIYESTSSPDVADKLMDQLQTFALAFPNWQDAFGFATYFFVQQRADGIAAIDRLR